MGKIIEKIAINRGHKIINTSNSKNPASCLNLEKTDVAIDFSNPESAFNNISYAIKNKTPIISGTTSWTKKMGEIKNLCLKENGSFLYSSNFSLGMNILLQINNQLAKIMKEKEYSCNIKEIHHIEKIDSPSGTALTIQEDLRKILKKNIKITSERIGDKIGIHNIKYSSKNDEIQIIHKAKKRNGFAYGAIIAAEWIVDKKGCFTMQDVLKNTT